MSRSEVAAVLEAVSAAESGRGRAGARPLMHPRRVLHIEYADTVNMADDLELAIA